MSKIDITLLRLKESILSLERDNEDMDTASWNYQIGALISGNEAKLIIETIEGYQKATEAQKSDNWLSQEMYNVIKKELDKEDLDMSLFEQAINAIPQEQFNTITRYGIIAEVYKKLREMGFELSRIEQEQKQPKKINLQDCKKQLAIKKGYNNWGSLMSYYNDHGGISQELLDELLDEYANQFKESQKWVDVDYSKGIKAGHYWVAIDNETKKAEVLDYDTGFFIKNDKRQLFKVYPTHYMPYIVPHLPEAP